MAMAAKSDNDETTGRDELHEIRLRRDSPVQGARDAFLELRRKLFGQVRDEIEPDGGDYHPSRLRSLVHDHLDALLDEQGIVVNRTERRQLLDALITDLVNSLK